MPKLPARAVFAFVALQLLAAASAADLVVDYSLAVHENGTVTPFRISIMKGHPSPFQEETGPCTVELLDANNQTIYRVGHGEFSFWMLSDPPKKVDKMPLMGDLVYTPEARALAVFNGSTRVFYYKLPESVTCNYNDRCEAGENAVSCFPDCDITTDVRCTPFIDGQCDGACPPGIDPDCEAQPPAPTPYSAPLSIPFFLAALTLALVVGGIGFVIYRQRSRGAARRQKKHD